MKGAPIVLDQSLPQNISLSSIKISKEAQVFPTKLAVQSTAQSYSTVVQQAIITQDKPLLKQIVTESEVKLINNTINELNVGRVSKLLAMLQEFLYLDSRHSEKYCLWIEEVVKRHTGILLSNHQNIPVIIRIRKYLQKRAKQRKNLMNIKSKLRIKAQQPKRKEFVAKFSYIQKKQQKMEQQQKLVYGDQDIDFNDEMFDEFDE